MDSFHTLPIGSIYAREEAASIGYLDIVQDLSPKIKEMISSEKTGSYIKGIARSYDVSEDNQPDIAFAILEIAIGKKTIVQLPSILSTELQLPIDTAQKMASEIEHDVFGPIKADLSGLPSQQKGSSVPSRTTAQAASSGMKNVLNLKEIAAKPAQGQLPPKPAQPSLPPRPSMPPKMPPSPIEPIRFT